MPILCATHPPHVLLFPLSLIPMSMRLTQRGHLLGEVRLAQAPEARAQHLKRWRPPQCPWEGKGETSARVARSRPQGTRGKESLLIGGHGSCNVGGRIPWGLQRAGEVFSHSPGPCPLPKWPGRLRAALPGLPAGSPRILGRKRRKGGMRERSL